MGTIGETSGAILSPDARDGLRSRLGVKAHLWRADDARFTRPPKTLLLDADWTLGAHNGSRRLRCRASARSAVGTRRRGGSRQTRSSGAHRTWMSTTTLSAAAPSASLRPCPFGALAPYHPPHAPRTQGEGTLSNGVERTSRRFPALGGLKYMPIYAFVRSSSLGTPLQVLPPRFASQIV
jgi:hypothetical protein